MKNLGHKLCEKIGNQKGGNPLVSMLKAAAIYFENTIKRQLHQTLFLILLFRILHKQKRNFHFFNIFSQCQRSVQHDV